MADEAKALERELEEHLVEQRSSLAMLQQALTQDSENPEIVSLCEELVVEIMESEKNLLYLKRSRLLREVEQVPEPSPLNQEHDSITEEQDRAGFAPGSKCRFRYTDGRWYNGKVIELEPGDDARVAFLTPTNERMQICRFYLQQRCRFGDNCRSSHGFSVRISALEAFVPLKAGDIEAGSVVLASSAEDGHGLWRNAEVEEWDGLQQRGRVVFTDDGSRSSVGAESLVLVEAEESSSSDEESSFDAVGIGYVNGTSTGQQAETVAFAKWEQHTRGMASKMMARMGYVAGTGLGLNRQGLVAPLQVRVLPARKSLDLLSSEAENKSSEGVKKSRGGKRKQRAKFAEARRAEKAQKVENEESVFDLINLQLASKGQQGSSSRGAEAKADVVEQDRRSLVNQEDEMKVLACKVSKLEEMAHRNRKDKAVHGGVMRKLVEARNDLSRAQAAHALAVNAVRNKEQEKKWMRF